MNKINDYVIYDTQGVCKIIDIQQDSSNREKKYYILSSVRGNLIIKTPVNNSSAVIRQILSEKEVNELIESMPKVESIWINDIKQRSITFKELLKTGKCKDLIKVIKTLYLKDLESVTERKKITITDKEILISAKKRLFEEFAFALNIPSDQIEDFIMKRVN